MPSKKKLTDVEITQIKEATLNDTRKNDPEEPVKEVEEAREDVENVLPYVNEGALGQGMENDKEREQELNQEEVFQMRTDILEELSIVQHTDINDP